MRVSYPVGDFPLPCRGENNGYFIKCPVSRVKVAHGYVEIGLTSAEQITKISIRILAIGEFDGGDKQLECVICVQKEKA